MSPHLDLAVLPDTKDSHSVMNASAVKTGAAEPESATFCPEEEMLCKSPHPNSCAAKRNRNPQLTDAVFKTCRAELGPIRGIPTGYESDDSWDISDAADQDCSRHQNITTLVMYPSSHNRPNRGRDQSHRPPNTIAVRGHPTPHPRPWQNQPYGRCTRSQEALRARAYGKLQCCYQLS